MYNDRKEQNLSYYYYYNLTSLDYYKTWKIKDYLFHKMFSVERCFAVITFPISIFPQMATVYLLKTYLLSYPESSTRTFNAAPTHTRAEKCHPASAKMQIELYLSHWMGWLSCHRIFSFCISVAIDLFGKIWPLFFCPNSFREFHDLPKMQSFSRRKEYGEASKRFPSAALALWFNTKFWRGQLVGSPEFESQPRPFRHLSAQLAVSLNASVWNSLAGSGPSFLSFCSPNGSLLPRKFAAEQRTCAWQFNLEMMYHLHSENYCQRGSCS